MITIWQPHLEISDQPIYLQLADALYRDIDNGTLMPGDKLPTVRYLAEELGITVGTVHRAYSKAESRGHIVRHVGRGSFIADEIHQPHIASMLPIPDQHHCNLAINAPAPVNIDDNVRETLSDLLLESSLNQLLAYGESRGALPHREAMAYWLNQRHVDAHPEQLIITSGAQSSTAIALNALANIGDTVLVENLTYSGIKSLLKLQGMKMKGVDMDRQGLIPDALEAICKQRSARLLVCMPNAHNPTGRTLSLKRREAIADIAERHQLLIIEDDLYWHTDPHLPSLQSLLPERVIHISSLSKCVSPGLRVGLLHAPIRFVDDLIAATQAYNWMAAPMMVELACRWIRNGTAAAIEQQRAEANDRRLMLAKNVLTGVRFESARHNTHLWLHLPAPWTAETFSQALKAHNISATPAHYFTASDTPCHAMRLSLGRPETDQQLTQGLATLKSLIVKQEDQPFPL